MKKITFIFALLAFLIANVKIASAATLDYKNGFLDQYKDSYVVINNGASNHNNMFDNNLGTMSTFANTTGATITILLPDKELDLEGLFISHFGWGSLVKFYDDKNVAFYTYQKGYTGTGACVSETIPLNYTKKISKITITGFNGQNNICEFDFFVKTSAEPVTYLTATSDFDSIKANWKNQSVWDSVKLYLNDQHVQTLKTPIDEFVIENLKANTDYKIGITSVTKIGTELVESTLTEKTIKTTSVPDLANEIKIDDIAATSAKYTIDYGLFKKKPVAIVVYKDGSWLARVTSDNFPVSGLSGETKYTYTFVADYGNDNLSNKKDISFTTKEGNREVTNLTATSTQSDVNLKWSMPHYKTLDFARIYRQKDDAGFFALMFSSNGTYEPLFETNGTTFKDLTVKADTEYKYKVTTVSTSNDESSGETISIKTKKISASGGGTDIDENGDYVITWTSPTTGKMKVLVGGKEYAIVPASDKKIVIPKDNMVFNIIGTPDVKLIPIDENGNEGETTTPGTGPGTGNGGGIGDIVGGGSLAELLTPDNILQASMGLIAVIASILLLRLAFMVAPRVISLIRNALNNKNNNVTYVNKRRADG